MNESHPVDPGGDAPRPPAGETPDSRPPDEAAAPTAPSVPPEESQRGTAGVPHAASGEMLAALGRMETTVKDIERRLEVASREEQHREFSFAWLIGALLQALVVGFVIAALADWIFAANPAKPLVKLAFAAVFQLGTLTAFIMARK